MPPGWGRSLGVVVISTGFAWAASGEANAAECGKAAWYDVGGVTASGEITPEGALTAAHRTLPFGTRVKVSNLANGRSVVVRVNDRGPFAEGRVIDVSRAAAEKLGFINAGLARVQLSSADGKAIKGACSKLAGPSKLVVAVSSDPPDPVPFPKARPLVADSTPESKAADTMIVPVVTVPTVGATGAPKAAESMAARFEYAFAESDMVELEMSKALQAFADQHIKSGRSGY